MVKRLEIFVMADGVRNTEVQRVECREQTNEKMRKRRMRKWTGRRGGGRGWYGSEGEGEKARGEMDRERWLCVILWTPFIYTWNRRPGLACKRLSWWGLKWNWHFQFVPWHVCLGLFTHSSASPTHAILLFTPSFSSFSLPLSPSHYSFPLPLYKPPPPSISVRLTLPCLLPPEHPQSNKEIWSRSLYRIYQTCPEKHMCTLHYKYAFCTRDSFQETDASERIKDWLHSLYGK